MEDWVTIRNMKKRNPDLGTRAIARILGIARTTVKKALVSETYPRYQRPHVVNNLIKPFEDYLREAYLVKHQKVSVILENLQSKGFTGSPISLYRYINRHLKPEKKHSNTRTYMPYETLPGEQMQYDWAEYSVLLGSTRTKVYVHLTELGYSRYGILSASCTIRQSDVFEALEDAFSELNGYASRIQVDNAKVFVDNASTAHFQWNLRFLQFSGFYGFAPTRSLPGHPWSKGKVERPFAYIEDHFITNNQFESFDDFLKKLKEFQKMMNDRIHKTTGEKPSERFGREQSNLVELPATHFLGFGDQTRKVTSDCLIAYHGNRYSVPHLYARQEVWVRVSKGVSLTIYSLVGKLIATHTLRSGRGHVIVEKEHYQGYVHQADRESYHLAGQKLKDRFSSYLRIDEFILAVKAQKRVNVTYNLSMIQRLFEDYADNDCVRCMDDCFRFRCFTFSFIKGFMTTKAHVMVDIPPGMTRFAVFSGEVKRSMKEYQL
jgi:transposase